MTRIILQAAGLDKGIDIFEGPPIEYSTIDGKDCPPASSIAGQVSRSLDNGVPPNTNTIEADKVKLRLLTSELTRSPGFHTNTQTHSRTHTYLDLEI